MTREPAVTQPQVESRAKVDSLASAPAPSPQTETPIARAETKPVSGEAFAEVGPSFVADSKRPAERIGGSVVETKRDAVNSSLSDSVSRNEVEVKLESPTIQESARPRAEEIFNSRVEGRVPEFSGAARDNEPTTHRAAFTPTVPSSSSSNQASSRPSAASESLTDSKAASAEQAPLALPSNLTFRSTASSLSTLKESAGDAKNLSAPISVSPEKLSSELIQSPLSEQNPLGAPQQESAARPSRPEENSQPEAIVAPEVAFNRVETPVIKSTSRDATPTVESRVSNAQSPNEESETARLQLKAIPTASAAPTAVNRPEIQGTTPTPAQSPEVEAEVQFQARIVAPRISSAPVPTPSTSEPVVSKPDQADPIASPDASSAARFPTESVDVKQPANPAIPAARTQSQMISSAPAFTPSAVVEQPVLPASHPSVDAPRAEVPPQERIIVDSGSASVAPKFAPEISVSRGSDESRLSIPGESKVESKAEFETGGGANLGAFVAQKVPARIPTPESGIVPERVAGKASQEPVVAAYPEAISMESKPERLGADGREVQASVQTESTGEEVLVGLPSARHADAAPKSQNRPVVAPRDEAPASRNAVPQFAPQATVAPRMNSEVQAPVAERRPDAKVESAMTDRAESNLPAPVESPFRREETLVRFEAESVISAPQTASNVISEKIVDRPVVLGGGREFEARPAAFSNEPTPFLASTPTPPSTADFGSVTRPEVAVQSASAKSAPEMIRSDVPANPEIEARPEAFEPQTASNRPTGNSLPSVPSSSAGVPVETEEMASTFAFPSAEANREESSAPFEGAPLARLTPDMMANPAFGAMMPLVPSLAPAARGSGGMASRTVEGGAMAAVSGAGVHSPESATESESETRSGAVEESISALVPSSEPVMPNPSAQPETSGEGDSGRGDSRDPRRETGLPAQESERSFEVPVAAMAPVSSEPVMKRAAKPSAVRVESDPLASVRSTSSRFVESNRSESKGSAARHPLETRELQLGMPAAFRAVDMAHEPTTDKFAGNTAQGLPGETSPRGTSTPEVDRSLNVAAAAASTGAVAPSRLELPTRSESAGASHGDRVQETVDRLQTMMSAHASSVVAGHSDELRAVLRPDSGTEIHLHVRREADRIEMTARCQGNDAAAWQTSWSDLQQRMRAQGVVLQPLEVGGRGTGSNTGFGTGTDSDRPRSQGGASGSDDRDGARRDSSSGRRPTLEQAPQETVSRRPSRRVTPRVAEYWA